MSDNAVQPADLIARMVQNRLVGNFVLIAEVYDSQTGAPCLVVKRSHEMTPWAEIGMLDSAMNRATLIDSQGWEDAMRGDDDDDY